MQDFFTGDIVTYIGDKRYWKYHPIHIIKECNYIGNGEFKYSTTQGAWFEASSFKLVERATKKSFKQLDKFIEKD